MDYKLGYLSLAGVSITLVISGHWRCNRRLWPLKWRQGPSLMKSKQTAVRNLTGGGRPPVTGFYWNPCLGHYLFLVAHSFPRASLSENCSLLGTDNVRGQISEHIFAQMASIVYIFPNFQNCAGCEKDLKDNKDYSRHLGWNHARIFVLGHYLFLVAHSFPRANCSLLGTDNVRKQFPSIFSRQMATIVYSYHALQIW